MRLVFKSARAGIAALAVCGLTSSAMAQYTNGSGLPPPLSPVDQADVAAKQAAQAASPIPAEFGILSSTILQIHASQFTPRSPAASLNYTTSTEVVSNITGFYFWAPVNLPEGAVVDYLDLYACDTSASNHMTVFMSGYSGSTTPALTDFWFLSSAQIAGSGCGYWVSTPTPSPFVIKNNVEYASGYQYVVNLSFGAIGAANRFRAADIWWHRQVSPAPVSASFADVSTIHPYFQFIEALKASGITGGCAVGPPATYCPDAPLTRGQMAVFLAKALGLHWPL